MGKHGRRASIPVWARVPAIIALVLAGVLVSAMLLSARRDSGGGRQEPHHLTQFTDRVHGTGGSHSSSGRVDHGGNHGTATTSR